MDDVTQHGGAGRRDDGKDTPGRMGGVADAGGVDGGMGGMHEGPQHASDGSAEQGRVGESPRQGQGGYGNDTGFTGGTSGATDAGAGTPGAQGGVSDTGMNASPQGDGEDADLSTEMDEATRRPSSGGSQAMDGGMR